ncbi:MAG TPA: PAS domain S-box protein [Deltaproteobacteria bacterium]|nr:PAS domain S-box protein [Deltaproteobacteria bacterium]
MPERTIKAELPEMISTKRLLARLTIRLELYINLIVVPLAMYYGSFAGRYTGEKLHCLITASVIAAALATFFGMAVRIWKLTTIMNNLRDRTEDDVSIKLKLLSYPRTESTIITLRWIFGLICIYAIMRQFYVLNWIEILPIFFILLLCIPINSIISYCTTEHLLFPVLQEERMKNVYIPRERYKLFSVSYRTTLIVISILIIPLITLSHFLFISHLETIRLTDLSLHVFIVMCLSLSAIFVTVYESNAGIQSGLKMTVQTLDALEKGNLDVEAIPLLTKGEIGIISQYVNILAHSLKNSEEMFSKAFRSSPVGIALWTLNSGLFLNVNESFIKITGYSREEVVANMLRDVNLFQPYEEYERMVHILQRQGQVRNFDTRFHTSSGHIRHVTISAEKIMLYDEPCMIATIEDITEKKILEKEVLRISEQERQMIGQDLHDDLAPHLIGIEVMSELLKRKLEENIVPSTTEVEKIRCLIEEAIIKTRRLSRGLCPVFLADHGLESLLQEMASNIEEVYGITCTFAYQKSIMVDDISVCTHIYYIVHESIYNALKHGKAKRINIDLLYDSNIVTLRIKDDGSGMQHEENPHGMGLKIMNFRANMIGADLHITSDHDSGTLVTLSFKHNGQTDNQCYE